MKTCHSEIAQLKTVFIKSAKNAFVNDEKISAEWQKLNFLSKPDFENSNLEYQNFENY